ncbi:hypothetical protein [Rahnella woolbedingensis]|uniref:Uncharacterized protein n=1 Tax=Rahnella woolbedingensis TaxID=1510574 RepID=A0A419N9K3_9GAMM|nr:hypothetical protein [Rahnella woolbedingensis]RJT44328.1 hypothetical protein D6C13_11300 [Rahnella woolbedingensis]
MRSLKVISLITLLSVDSHAEGYKLHPGIRTFQGQKFEIELKAHCPETRLACNDVSYEAINKKTGERLHLKGRVLTNYYSHDFRGFEFKNGNYIYTLRPDSGASNDVSQIWNLNVPYMIRLSLLIRVSCINFKIHLLMPFEVPQMALVCST